MADIILKYDNKWVLIEAKLVEKQQALSSLEKMAKAVSTPPILHFSSHGDLIKTETRADLYTKLLDRFIEEKNWSWPIIAADDFISQSCLLSDASPYQIPNITPHTYYQDSFHTDLRIKQIAKANNALSGASRNAWIMEDYAHVWKNKICADNVIQKASSGRFWEDDAVTNILYDKIAAFTKATQSLLIIDEPEHHLHPNFLSKIDEINDLITLVSKKVAKFAKRAHRFVTDIILSITGCKILVPDLRQLLRSVIRSVRLVPSDGKEEEDNCLPAPEQLQQLFSTLILVKHGTNSFRKNPDTRADHYIFRSQSEEDKIRCYDTLQATRA